MALPDVAIFCRQTRGTEGMSKRLTPGSKKLTPGSQKAEAPGSKKTTPASQKAEAPGSKKTTPASQKAEAPGSKKSTPGSQKADGRTSPGSKKSTPGSQTQKVEERGVSPGSKKSTPGSQKVEKVEDRMTQEEFAMLGKPWIKPFKGMKVVLSSLCPKFLRELTESNPKQKGRVGRVTDVRDLNPCHHPHVQIAAHLSSRLVSVGRCENARLDDEQRDRAPTVTGRV
jgi:hypothetical protein